MTEEKKEIPQIESAIYGLENNLKVKVDWFYTYKPKEEKKEDSEEKKEDSEEEDEETKNLGEEIVNLEFSTLNDKTLILHWGLFKAINQGEWHHPSKENYPEKTKEFDKNALQTEFISDKNANNEEIENLKKKFEEFKQEIQIEENERKKNKHHKKKKDDKKNKKEEEEKKKQEEKIEYSNNIQKIKMTIPRGSGYSKYIGGLNFVFFEPETNKWYNNYRRDYQIKFKLKINKRKSKQILVESGLYVPEFVLDVINCEANYGSWTLMHRYNKCYDIIQTFNEETSNEKWIWILIWLKFSNQRHLDWQRNYNTRPVLLSNAMNKLSYDLTNRFSQIFQKEKLYNNLFNSTSSLIKNILSQMGKGVGNGQEIRDEILKVMSRNKIVKNPLNNFYEQWHQKLHNNTTPEDITICEAVIEFLKSGGKMEVYWKVLNDGGITKERLASYDRKIINEPWYNPNYNIADFENYLQIIKRVHSTTDLIMSYEQCKYAFEEKDIKLFEQLINNKDSKDTLNQIKKVTETREYLQGIMKKNLNDIKKLRDILFFELSLEVYARQLVEKIIHIKIDYDKYIEEINFIMRNIKISYPNYSEFTLCLNDWFGIVDKLKKDNSKDSALKVKSVVSRINRLLSNVIDFHNKYFDSRARYFGKECGVENEYCELFAEEMVRGTIFFALSILLKKIEPTIRKNAELSDWLIISRGKSDFITGNLIHVKNLHEVQFMKYEEKTIILTENVDGNEEIPINCNGLIIIKSENYPDILAHVSVRARNLNCLFGVCFNESICDEMLKLINNKVKASIIDQKIHIEKIDDNISNDNDIKNEEKIEKVNIADVGDKYEKIFIELNEFNSKFVGAKSNNTQKIYMKIPDCDFIKYPESFSIPFNVNEYFLSLSENMEIKEEINEYISKIKLAIKKEDIRNLLEKCKEQTLKIKYVENSETQKLKEKLISFGIKESEFEQAFTSIKRVWASKYNERVYIATSKVGISLEQIKMSVLCQKIIPSEYAYVMHTKNPMTNNKNELFAEIVCGMGETLVGAFEGQSFSFVYYKDKNNYEIKSYPNKSISLQNSGFIFRSDSNTEDLEGFSGAGLFDSVPMINDNEVEISYANNKFFNDKKFVDDFINKVSSLGIGVEKLYNGVEQDIEGCYYNGDFFIVQTRPQV